MPHPVVNFPKPCEICGEVFKPLTKTSRYCSRACYAVARVGKPKHSSMTSKARKLARSDAAWLAGLFDGEGSIVFVHKDRPTPSARITICNTCRPLLERVQEVSGIGQIIVQRRAGQDNPNHSASWVWQTYSANARDLLAQMLPWLIVKREKAEAALARRVP
jgi:hypothetical protein